MKHGDKFIVKYDADKGILTDETGKYIVVTSFDEDISLGLTDSMSDSGWIREWEFEAGKLLTPYIEPSEQIAVPNVDDELLNSLYDKIDKLELANRNKLQLLKDMEIKYIAAQEIISHLFRGGINEKIF